MMRVTQLLRAATTVPAPPPPVGGRAPVVIWNLLRRCNLSCSFCYSGSADARFPGELSTDEILRGLDDLRGYGVTTLVLSGGEPLLHPDLSMIARRAKALGLFVSLSTNGTLIDRERVTELSEVGYDHVGISLDGVGATHDHIRGKPGAYEASLRGLRLCREAGLKVGVRFTLTRDNRGDLLDLLDLTAREGVSRFYLSHLNYAGRGARERDIDAWHSCTRGAMLLLFETAWADIAQGQARELVTGNNDADGAFLLGWVRRRWPDRAAALEERLRCWGGNAAGIGIANIDSQGRVHPDSMMEFITLGTLRDRPFSAIWRDQDQQPVLAQLRQRPRPVTGRCAACRYLYLCNGNTRTRAYRTQGDLWAADPGCYLSDDEVMASEGIKTGQA